MDHYAKPRQPQIQESFVLCASFGLSSAIQEGGTRTPFITWWPGTIESGVSDDVGCTIDLATSLATYLGVAIPDDACLDSQDVMSALLGKDGATSRSQLIQQDNGRDGVNSAFGYRSGKWKLQRKPNSPPRKKAGEPDVNRVQLTFTHTLYDLESDPAESRNVAKQHPEVFQRMKAELQKLLDAARWILFGDLGWEFDPERNPDEHKSMKQLAEKHKSKLGIWMSPRGGYGHFKRTRLKIAKRNEKGYNMDKGIFELSDPIYRARFREVCFDFLRNQGVNSFKFDGFTAKNDSVREALIRIIEEMREEQPDLFVNTTIGSWPSPFFLMNSDSIWRGGVVPGLKETSVKDWKDENRSFFATGDNLQELYIAPDHPDTGKAKMTEDRLRV